MPQRTKNGRRLPFYLAIGIYCEICNFPNGTYLEYRKFAAILLQRVMTLPSEMPWPFLGVSSLNLAAPLGAAFFLAGDRPLHEALRLTGAQERRNDAPFLFCQRIAL
jgi:hypothetical protein